MSQQSNHLETQPDYTMSSASAVSSMIFGIASPLGICTCLSPLVTSLLAIVMGHISLSKIKQSNGRLTGKGQAITGLILGYIFFPLSLVMVVMYYSGLSNIANDPSSRVASVRSGLDNAERKLVGLREGGTSGNNPQAIALAGTYGQLLTTMVQETITDKNGKKVDDKVSVYCHQKNGSVCFIAKIPGYNDYNTEAKEGLAKMAWQCGRIATAQSELPEDTLMGIGLKGFLLYGAVMVDESQSETPRSNGKSKEVLNRFFSDNSNQYQNSQ